MPVTCKAVRNERALHLQVLQVAKENDDSSPSQAPDVSRSRSSLLGASGPSAHHGSSASESYAPSYHGELSTVNYAGPSISPWALRPGRQAHPPPCSSLHGHLLSNTLAEDRDWDTKCITE